MNLNNPNDYPNPYPSNPVDPNTTSERLDLTTIYFCQTDNMCLLKTDLIGGKCKKCAGDVTDISGSPVANAWLVIVHPYPKKKGWVG